MIRLIAFAALGYLAYRFTQNWYIGAGAAIIGYALYAVFVKALSGSRSRRSTDGLLHRKMTAAEKVHFGQVADHQRAMDAHRAQFDPELRKKTQ